MPRGRDDPRAEVGRLYDLYGASLYRYALMILADPAGAEDVIQQVFVALLVRRRGIDDEQRYLRRAVRNECYSTLRRRVRAQEGPLLEAVGPDTPPDERIALEKLIRDLPPDQREALHLHVFEAAALLSMTLGLQFARNLIQTTPAAADAQASADLQTLVEMLGGGEAAVDEARRILWDRQLSDLAEEMRRPAERVEQ